MGSTGTQEPILQQEQEEEEEEGAIKSVHSGKPKVCYHFSEKTAVVENGALPLVRETMKKPRGTFFLGALRDSADRNS